MPTGTYPVVVRAALTSGYLTLLQNLVSELVSHRAMGLSVEGPCDLLSIPKV
jgi:hypothetical protein